MKSLQRSRGSSTSSIFDYSNLTEFCKIDKFKSLGEGAFGCVHPGKIKCAIKRLAYVENDITNSDAKKNGLSEVKKLTAIAAHSFIVRYYDHRDDGRSIWIMLEYCNEGQLDDYLSKNTLDVGSKINIFKQCASAIGFLHKNGLTHNDIKPSNVLVKSELGKFVVKICDISGSSMVGTEAYLAPELYAKKKQVHAKKCDVFSLGLLFHVTLKSSTEPSFGQTDGKSFGESLYLYNHVKHEKPPTAAPRLDKVCHNKQGLDALIENMSSFHPNDRPPIHRVLEELQKIKHDNKYLDSFLEHDVVSFSRSESQSSSHKLKYIFSASRKPQKYYSEESPGILRFEPCIRLTFTVVLFCITLCSLIVSKGGILFISSQLNPFLSIQQTQAVNGKSCGSPVCLEGENCSEKQTVRWIWAMFICVCTPYFIAWLKCVWKLLTSRTCYPPLRLLIMMLVIESLHSLGMFLLLFHLLPYFDVFRSLLILTAVALLPNTCQTIDHVHSTTLHNAVNVLKLVISILSGCVQIAIPIIWIIIISLYPVNNTENKKIEEVCNKSSQPESTSKSDNTTVTSTFVIPEHVENYWFLCFALFLISFGYFEDSVLSWQSKVVTCGTKLYFYISLWKIAFTFLLVVCFNVENVELFDAGNFYDNKCNSTAEGLFEYDWLQVAIIQNSVSLLAFCSAALAIKSQLQVICYTIPLTLSTPTTLLFLFWACESCEGVWDIDSLYFWNCYSGRDSLGVLFIDRYVYLGLFLWLSQLWISRQLWFPQQHTSYAIDRLLSPPLYCGGLIEQSLCFYRRGQKTNSPSNDISFEDEVTPNIILPSQIPHPNSTHTKDGVPFVYVCVTMWRESKEKVKSIIASVLRLHLDQIWREQRNKYLVYKFEAHMFLDDAFMQDGSGNSSVNYCVKEIVQYVEETMHEVLNIATPLDVTKYSTPYGGRLEWIIPGGSTKLILHLKDKTKVSNNTRWSKAMWIHFLLFYGIRCRPASSAEKFALEANTFILAVDGDTEFSPQSLVTMLEWIKSDPHAAAVSGRIHPVGSALSPLLWCQKFEYSLSHWLQTSTEYMLGSVLFSPDSFSLYRAEALMDAYVVGNYSRHASGTINYIKHDIGEHYWLSTLLLEAGYKLSYCPAADGYKYGYIHFHQWFGILTQRQMSQFMNWFKFLRNCRQICKMNRNIHMFYLTYQWMRFICYICTPVAITMFVAEVLQEAFEIPFIVSFVCYMLPLLAFAAACCTTTSDNQRSLAAVLTLAYATVQMGVLYEIFVLLGETGLCSTVAVVFVSVVAIVTVTALIHPQEFSNIIHIFTYFLLLPSLHVLTTIYSVCNLHKLPRRIISDVERITIGRSDYKYSDKDLYQLIASLPAREMSQLGYIKVELSHTESTSYTSGPHSDDPIRLGIPVSDIHEELSAEISEREDLFWRLAIRDHLYPVEMSNYERLRCDDDLKSLRTSMATAFLLLNMLLVVPVLCHEVDILQNPDSAIVWTCTHHGRLVTQTLNPIAIFLMCIFGTVLSVQFLGMLFSRFHSFLYMAAKPRISRKQPQQDDLDKYAILDLLRILQRLEVDSETGSIFTVEGTEL